MGDETWVQAPIEEQRRAEALRQAIELQRMAASKPAEPDLVLAWAERFEAYLKG